MLEIETQLSLYADAVEERFGADSTISSVGPLTSPAPLELVKQHEPNAGSDKNHRAGLALAAAAALLIGLVGTVVLRDRSATNIATDIPVVTTEPPSPQNDVGPLLPSSEWLMTNVSRSPISSPKLTDGAAEPGASETPTDANTVEFWAFESEAEGLLILVSRPSEDPRFSSEVPSDLLEDATLGHDNNNRSMMSWTVGDEQLTLMGFDLDESTLRTAAESIVSTDGGWSLPGAVPVAADVTGQPGEAAGSPQGEGPGRDERQEVTYASVLDAVTGEVDLGIVVTETSDPAMEIDLYLTLFDASDLGVVERLDIAGRPAYLVGADTSRYALLFRNGRLITWQGSSGVDMRLFLESLSPASQEIWDSAADQASQTRQQALDQAAAASTPIEIVSLPRYRLNSPWTLERASDRSLWTAAELGEVTALEQADITSDPGGFPVSRWIQGFRLAGNGDGTSVDGGEDFADIGVGVSEVVGGVLIPGCGNDDEHEFDSFGFTGCLIPALEDRPSMVSMRSGQIIIDIESYVLSDTELVDFAKRLEPRDGNGLRGLDLLSSEFEFTVDRPAASGSQTPQASYSTNWVSENGELRVSIGASEETDEQWRNGLLPSFWRSQDPGYFEDSPYVRVGQGTLEWRRPELGITVHMRAGNEETFFELVAIADTIRQISESEWDELVRPVNETAEETLRVRRMTDSERTEYYEELRREQDDVKEDD